ncbi:MAG: ABC transporter substrate-binding protein [Lachnospiraceae bacterium]
MAKNWNFDEDTCTYTFHLQQGVKWHDGEEFTADDVKFTIEAIMDPENGSENAPNYEDVEQITVEDPTPFSADAPECGISGLYDYGSSAETSAGGRICRSLISSVIR